MFEPYVIISLLMLLPVMLGVAFGLGKQSRG